MFREDGLISKKTVLYNSVVIATSSPIAPTTLEKSREHQVPHEGADGQAKLTDYGLSSAGVRLSFPRPPLQ
ncbi:hypothetical protein PC116_g26241 [Phytophthora cactorum]|nr:hypothetical protein PC112_g22110 [Phytophthora cactorum]KAG4225321.1 hypothetical protein PC116_g26241 [Phytophthora cactorum]